MCKCVEKYEDKSAVKRPRVEDVLLEIASSEKKNVMRIKWLKKRIEENKFNKFV
jgi:hypothetical protein